MSKSEQFYHMRKSETGVVLPSIRTHRNSLTTKPRMKSVFIQRVKQQVNDETTYEVMNTSRINDEQRRLKQLLREFNDRSHMILTDFIAEPNKLVETSPTKVSNQEVIKVREQEGANLNKVMVQCQVELKLLESRCDNLKYTTREEMEKQIQNTRRQIQQLRVQKKQLQRGVTVDGLNICRGERYDLIKELQYEKLQLEIKKDHMTAHNGDLLKELDSVKTKIIEADKQTANKDAEYKSALNALILTTQAERYKDQIKEKKKQIEQSKVKNDNLAGTLKQKYFTKLKQLESINHSNKQAQNELVKKGQTAEQVKVSMIVLQHKYSALRQGVTTMELLVPKKKQ